jgi:hypothetical protein
MNQGPKRFTISLLFAYFLAFLTELIEVKDNHGEFSFVDVIIHVVLFMGIGFLFMKLRRR